MEAVKRRAPKNGYDNDAKQEYRENVWSYMAPKVIPLLKENKNARVLLLPSKEGLEIDVAIKHGVNPEQIIAIDENPALLAHAQWKDKIPRENRFGCKVSKVGEKIKNNGWYLVGANLDFCNNFSEELINEVNSFFEHTPISKRFTFCITMGKGRESKALYLLLKHLKTPEIFEHDRMAALYEMINLNGNYKSSASYKDILTLDFEKSYYSSFPMIYACFTFHPFHDDVFLKEKKRYEILHNRLWSLKDYTISRKDGYNKPRLTMLLKEYKDMKSGKYWEESYFKRYKDDENYKNKRMESVRGEINRIKRYIKHDIGFNDLQDKRRGLVNETNHQLTSILDSIHDMLDLYCKNNNIIRPEKYKESYRRFFAYSQIRDGKLKS